MLRAARRLLRRKERQIARRFLAEGPQAISEALGRPNTVIELMVVEDSLDRHRELLEDRVRSWGPHRCRASSGDRSVGRDSNATRPGCGLPDDRRPSRRGAELEVAADHAV